MLDISSVINVSVSTPPAGIAPFGVNNLLCLTDDTPIVSLGTDVYRIYTSAAGVATDWGTVGKTYAAALAVFGQSPNIRSGGGVFIVAPLLTSPSLETIDAAITRLIPLVFFGGVSYAMTASPATLDKTNAASVCQANRKLLFLGSSSASDLAGPSGLFYTIRSATQTQTRCLLHTISAQLPAYVWGYASRSMSTDFSGSNTTSTMQLKQISGVTEDTGITSTIATNAQTVGADIYPAIAGRPSVQSYGANGFFDDIYNLNWFVLALEVAGFNLLATTSTKIPQTESGMAALRSAYRSICVQAVSNRFVGPGAWTGTDTFGDPQDFNRNINDNGFYIYSQPVAAQSVADRSNRLAPLVQIAIKYQGALHTSSVSVFINR